MQLRQELRLLVKGGEAANSARDAVAQRRLVPAVVQSRWSGGESGRLRSLRRLLEHCFSQDACIYTQDELLFGCSRDR